MMSFTLGLDKGVQLGRYDHPWHCMHKTECTFFLTIVIECDVSSLLT